MAALKFFSSRLVALFATVARQAIIYEAFEEQEIPECQSLRLHLATAFAILITVQTCLTNRLPRGISSFP